MAYKYDSLLRSLTYDSMRILYLKAYLENISIVKHYYVNGDIFITCKVFALIGCSLITIAPSFGRRNCYTTGTLTL